MTRWDRMNLTEAVRNCIAECRAVGRYQTHNVVELVLERHALLVEEASQRLAAEAIAGIARRLMKSSTAGSNGQQVLFPPDLQHLSWSHSISLPPANLESDEGEEEGEDYVWVGLDQASVAELGLHIRLLADSITKDQKRLGEMQRLYDHVAPHVPPGQEDVRIIDVLKRLQEEGPED